MALHAARSRVGLPQRVTRRSGYGQLVALTVEYIHAQRSCCDASCKALPTIATSEQLELARSMSYYRLERVEKPAARGRSYRSEGAVGSHALRRPTMHQLHGGIGATTNHWQPLLQGLT